MVRYLNHIFLIYHYPMCFRKQFFHLGMEIFKGIGIEVPFDVCFHHARLCHTGTDDGTCGNKGDIIVAIHFFQKLSHSGRFDVEASGTLSGAKQGIDFIVCLELGGIVNINGDTSLLFHHLHGILDMS